MVSKQLSGSIAVRSHTNLHHIREQPEVDRLSLFVQGNFITSAWRHSPLKIVFAMESAEVCDVRNKAKRRNVNSQVDSSTEKRMKRISLKNWMIPAERADAKVLLSQSQIYISVNFVV